LEQPVNMTLAEKYFHISLNKPADAVWSTPVVDLTQPETVSEALTHSAQLLKAFDLKLPASFLGLSLYNVCAALFVFAAKDHLLLDVSLSNLTLHLVTHHDHVHGAFQMTELRYKKIPEDQRETVLRNAFNAFFHSSLTPLVESIASAAGVKPALIWNQFGARMAYSLDFMKEIEADEEVLQRFNHIHKLITEDISPDVFNLRNNPFFHIPVYLDSPHKPGKKTILRSSCCMYYCREGGGKCFNCPALTTSEREAMRLHIEQSRQQTASTTSSS
jgi:ferric iron reductase protein FhuF